ncbi:MAG TPA: hypothetical protein ENK23_08370 [Sorangium sp.]|nr:hypothetical protein [Sorangium sp.]
MTRAEHITSPPRRRPGAEASVARVMLRPHHGGGCVASMTAAGQQLRVAGAWGAPRAYSG